MMAVVYVKGASTDKPKLMSAGKGQNTLKVCAPCTVHLSRRRPGISDVDLDRSWNFPSMQIQPKDQPGWVGGAIADVLQARNTTTTPEKVVKVPTQEAGGRSNLKNPAATIQHQQGT